MTDMHPDTARLAALEAFLRRQAKDRPGEVKTLADPTTADVAVISTGIIGLDVALGIGGLPRGRIVELYGPAMSGKTAVALSTAAQCQRAGGIVGFVDAEHALSREFAERLGVDPARFVVFQPDSGEQAIEMVDEMLDAEAFDMIIVDSVAAMTPLAEIEGQVTDQHMALHPRLMSRFMRLVDAKVANKHVLLVLINQVRTNLGQYGAPDTTTGGKAIPFFASVRIEIRSPNSKRIERNKVAVGQTCVATVKKNKLAAPFRTCEYDLYYDAGFATGRSLLAVAESMGVIERKGTYYVDTTSGEQLGQGKEAVFARLEADPELVAALTAEVYRRLGTRD